jgi:hypothetical protein
MAIAVMIKWILALFMDVQFSSEVV